MNLTLLVKLWVLLICHCMSAHFDFHCHDLTGEMVIVHWGLCVKTHPGGKFVKL